MQRHTFAFAVACSSALCALVGAGCNTPKNPADATVSVDPKGVSNTTPDGPPLAITTAVALNTNTLAMDGALTASVTVTNTTAAPYTIGELFIAAVQPGGTHAAGPQDRLAPELNQTTVAPGQSVTLTASRMFSATDPSGTWEAYAAFSEPSGQWFESDSVAFAHGAPSSALPTPQPPPSTPTPATPGAPALAPTGPIVEAGATAPGDVRFDVRADTGVHAISPLIYGINQLHDLGTTQRGSGMLRAGGNRYTAFNWENGASNAGTDYNNQSDNYLVAGAQNPDAPGEAIRMRADQTLATGASMLVTIAMQGYAAADKNGGGDVGGSPNYLTTRFKQSVAKKNAPFTLSPDTSDGAVYQDEFANWLLATYPNAFGPSGARVLFSLDNEPDLWSSTHPRLQPAMVQPQTLIDKSVEYASAVKAVIPSAEVFGFVSYGYGGFKDLQGTYAGDYTAHFLAALKAASDAAGKRLVDVLDLHWYPEARGDNCRITGTCTTAGAVEARLQAPRSLWDPTYVETSWVESDFGAPLQLIPEMKKKIAANNPGTKLSFTEYYYGAGEHISGAIAQADVLGIFGREDVYAASMWEQGSSNLLYAAMRMFTAYDGKDARFGDTSVQAATSDVAKTSVYASVDAKNPSRMVLVAINKTAAPVTAGISLAAYGSYTAADVWQLTAAVTTSTQAPSVTASAPNAFSYTMPAYSVSVLVPR
jgi:hypothetical protein